MKIRIEGQTEVLKGLSKASDEVKKEAARVVRAASFALEKRIKREMPVDTGRARAGWGHWSPFAIGTRKSHKSIKSRDASSDDAIWEESQDGLSITQGTTIPYVKLLNEGSSTQAPRGFIEKGATFAQRVLVRKVGKMIDKAMK